MNKLKIPLAIIHTVLGLFGAWAFLSIDYVNLEWGAF